jgi:heat-inducible transcriptional repressor
MNMDERKQKILKAIVQDYIETAEPVGSRTISRKSELGVSPATIRNEMSDLEDMGLIEQPYTSAGRIPSDKGYRYYVDYLLGGEGLSTGQKDFIDQEFSGRVNEVQVIIENMSKLISKITNLTSIVLGPHKRNNILEKLYFLPYAPGQAIMVTVKENGQIENHIVEIGNDTKTEDLQVLANMFNEKISGVRIEDMSTAFYSEIYQELSQKRRMIESMMGIIERMTDQEDSSKVYLGGMLNMLNHPEFKNLNKVRPLLEVFEEERKLKSILEKAEDGLAVTIGGENSEEALRDCSVITATYQVNGRRIGSVGVLGPTRLDYGKTIAIVDYLTKSLTELLTNRYQKLGP